MTFCPDAAKRLAAGKAHIAGLLDRSDVLILDTETTGHRQAEIIELSLIDTSGKVLFDRLIRPRRMHMNRYAYRVHGISLEALAHEPTLPELLPELDAILQDRLVLAWNAPYDHLMVQRSRQIWGLEARAFRHQCAMQLFAALHGRKSFGLHNAILASGLEGMLALHESHRALGDVNLVLGLLRAAAAERVTPTHSVALP